jgi:hypothetical protein
MRVAKTVQPRVAVLQKRATARQLRAPLQRAQRKFKAIEFANPETQQEEM